MWEAGLQYSDFENIQISLLTTDNLPLKEITRIDMFLILKHFVV